jgi:hypothetical protein
MAVNPDTTSIDSHECELEPLDGEEFESIDDKGRCTVCGTVTTPAKGVKNAKRERMW